MLKKVLLSSIIFSTPLLGARILLSDAEKTEQSFAFNIGSHDLYIPDGRIFVGAAEGIRDNSFAVAAVGRNEAIFRPLTPAKVKLNNEKDKDNPLFGAAIKQLTLLGSRPIVTKQNVPASVFLIDEGTTAVYEASLINDAQGQVTKNIIALETTASSVVTPVDLNSNLAAFAAVTNQAGGFDGDGSGIALMFFKRFTDKKKNNEAFFTWDIVNAQNAVSQFTTKGKPQAGGNKAAPLGKTSPSLAINSPLSSIENVVDLHYDRDIGRLYIALQVKAGAGSNDGARALILAGIENGRLLFGAVAPDSAFNDNRRIIGGRGANAITQLYKVRTMQTRTYLRYLIVVGGNDDTEENKRSVYALPIVSSTGALANVHSAPVTMFISDYPQAFANRKFERPATNPDDLYSLTSPEARVGGDGILPNAITDIVVAGEAVFVSVKEPGENLQPGIFYSQPLFDKQGKITLWTRWQRVAGAASAVTGFVYDPFKGTHAYIPEVIKNGKAQTHSVLRTEWTDGKDELGKFVSEFFIQSQGGVENLKEYPYSTPSLSMVPGTRLGVQIFTGFEKVLLVQSGADDQRRNFGPLPFSRKELFISQDGSLTNFQFASTLAFTGGALSQIGPVTSSAIITNGDDGWFVVGGSGGIAVLCGSDGHGWNAQIGLKSAFTGLTDSMRWKIVSTVPNVRKLIGIENKLFVLTDDTVLRFEINAANQLSENSPAILAQLSSGEKGQFKSYSDLIVSGPLALLATSFGLFRSGNGIDSMTVESDAHWVPVKLPESAGSLDGMGAATRLFTVSPSLVETDVAFGGTIYALNGFVSLSQAHIYRLALNVTGDQINDSSVQLYPDYFIKDRKTFFHNLGSYRNYFVTDGALFITSRSAFEKTAPIIELLPFTLKSGQVRRVAERVPFVSLTGRTFTVNETIRSAASGAWLASGDFGIRVLE